MTRTRLTSSDRDGAVKILSILTGGVTATALAATGVTMALAQQGSSGVTGKTDIVDTITSVSAHSEKAGSKGTGSADTRKTTHTFSTAKGTSDDDQKKAAEAKKRALNERCKVATKRFQASEARDDASFTYRAKAHGWSDDKIKVELKKIHRHHRLACPVGPPAGGSGSIPPVSAPTSTSTSAPAPAPTTTRTTPPVTVPTSASSSSSAGGTTSGS